MSQFIRRRTRLGTDTRYDPDHGEPNPLRCNRNGEGGQMASPAMIQSDKARNGKEKRKEKTVAKNVRAFRGWTSCAQLSYGLLGELMEIAPPDRRSGRTTALQ